MKSLMLKAGSFIHITASAATSFEWVKIIKENGVSFETFANVWFFLTLIFIIIGCWFIYLLRKLNLQKIEIDQHKEIINNLILATKRLENEQTVAELNGYKLIFTHLKNQVSKLYDNKVKFSKLSINNKVDRGSSDRRDSFVTMMMQGVFTEPCYTFKFAITGQSVVKAEDLEMKAFDNITHENIIVQTDNIGCLNEVKEFRLSFQEGMKTEGTPLGITITWKWPNMLDLKDDFITLPNFYSKKTAMIELSLEKSEDQAFNTVSIYKYGTFMESPEHIRDITYTKDNSNKFTFTLENPDQNVDYIMYYR